MVLQQITDLLESIAPLHYQEDYDNAGLIVGQSEQTITGAIISLDMTEEIVQEAIDKNCNLVIAHHPIIFRGLKKINGYHYVEKAIIKAIKNDIALYAIHTNLDNVFTNGVNGKIAAKLNLQNTKILAPKDKENPTIGSGMIGELDNPLDPMDFLKYLKSSLNIETIRHTNLLNNKIKKVAVCGGAGSFLLAKAISQKADIYISADFKYHEFFDANQQIIIADVGHYESEQYTIELLYDILTENFSNFALHCTEINTNPINYFR